MFAKRVLVFANVLFFPLSLFCNERFSYALSEGNLRLSGSLAMTNLEYDQKNASQLFWKGCFDYFLKDWVSVSGVSYLPIYDGHKSLNQSYFGMGGNLHFLKFNRIELFAGATAGFAIVNPGGLPRKALNALEFGVGTVLYDSFFHLLAEVNYRRSEYYSGSQFIELNQLLYSIGMGFHF
jgi:hypothetical protein